MIYRLAVPMVDEDVAEVRVLDWHRKPGERYAPGDMIVELETHKVVVEIRAARPGVFRQRLIANGDWCRVGLPLGLFSDEATEVLPAEAGLANDLLVDFEIV